MFSLKGPEGIALLDAWLKWAWRCQLPAFVNLAGAIRKHRAGIAAALLHGLSNARVESVIIWKPETAVFDVADAA